jgi:hypothetical protein
MNIIIFCIMTYMLYKLLSLFVKIITIPVCIILSVIGGLWFTSQIVQVF